MDRRSFLATSVSTGIMATAITAQPSSATAASLASDVRGLNKANIPTPALVVDLDAFEHNVQKIADHCRETKRGFRPHAKTHKCPEIAKRQIAAGALGICAATVSEAEALVTAGIPGVLLTSPIVDPNKIARMLKLVKTGTGVMLAVGNALMAQLLTEAVEAARLDVDVLVDLDVGDKRTGVMPGEQGLELARLIARCPRLHIRGVQAYAGHASHTVGFENRQRVSREAMTKAADTRALLEKSGFDAKILTGGSTGTYNIDSAVDGVTELQVGSYVFMDADYRRIGGQDGNAVYSDFRPSLAVLTTVISATHAEKRTVDAGTKGIDTTTVHKPESKTYPGLIYTKSGDEFGAITVEGDQKLPSLGERIEFIVPHCDPSTNLYDRIYACRGEQVEAIWPIAARREFNPAS